MLIYTKVIDDVIVDQTAYLIELIADLEVEEINAIIAKIERLDKGEKGFICNAYLSTYSRIECWRI